MLRLRLLLGVLRMLRWADGGWHDGARRGSEDVVHGGSFQSVVMRSCVCEEVQHGQKDEDADGEEEEGCDSHTETGGKRTRAMGGVLGAGETTTRADGRARSR